MAPLAAVTLYGDVHSIPGAVLVGLFTVVVAVPFTGTTSAGLRRAVSPGSRKPRGQ
jgi:hypothetical protein